MFIIFILLSAKVKTCNFQMLFPLVSDIVVLLVFSYVMSFWIIPSDNSSKMANILFNPPNLV